MRDSPWHLQPICLLPLYSEICSAHEPGNLYSFPPFWRSLWLPVSSSGTREDFRVRQHNGIRYRGTLDMYASEHKYQTSFVHYQFQEGSLINFSYIFIFFFLMLLTFHCVIHTLCSCFFITTLFSKFRRSMVLCFWSPRIIFGARKRSHCLMVCLNRGTHLLETSAITSWKGSIEMGERGWPTQGVAEGCVQNS